MEYFIHRPPPLDRVGTDDSTAARQPGAMPLGAADGRGGVHRAGGGHPGRAADVRVVAHVAGHINSHQEGKRFTETGASHLYHILSAHMGRSCPRQTAGLLVCQRLVKHPCFIQHFQSENREKPNFRLESKNYLSSFEKIVNREGREKYKILNSRFWQFIQLPNCQVVIIFS